MVSDVMISDDLHPYIEVERLHSRESLFFRQITDSYVRMVRSQALVGRCRLTTV